MVREKHILSRQVLTRPDAQYRTVRREVSKVQRFRLLFLPTSIVSLVFALSVQASYEIRSHVVSECGGENTTESDKYLVEFSVGQAATGTSSSSSYDEFAGFWYPKMRWDPYSGVGQPGLPPLSTDQYWLSRSSPSPFRHVTTIRYNLPEAALVRLTVFNIHGQKVKALVDEGKSAGRWTTEWDGTDSDGTPVASGIYFCAFRAGGFSSEEKVVLLR